MPRMPADAGTLRWILRGIKIGICVPGQVEPYFIGDEVRRGGATDARTSDHGKTAFERAFSYGTTKTFNEQNFTLLAVLALAGAHTDRLRALGLQIDRPPWVERSELLRLSSFARFRPSGQRATDSLRTYIQNHFRAKPVSVVQIRASHGTWRVQLHWPSANIRFEPGAVEALEAYLRNLLDDSSTPRLPTADTDNQSEQAAPRAMQNSAEHPVKPHAPFCVPYARNPGFVGREDDLERLHGMIRRARSLVAILPTALVGLGGIGKTQLVVEYCHAHRGEYSEGVFWLNAVNPLHHELAALALTLGLAPAGCSLEHATQRMWTFLDARPNALLVLDNVIEPAHLTTPFLSGLVIANLRCHVVFTTRQRSLPRGCTSFDVKTLPEPPAMRMLLRGRSDVLDVTHAEWGTARIVCASLGWLPLALELAGAFLAQYPEITLREYLERLRTEGRLPTLDDSEDLIHDLPTRHREAVTATLLTQWNRLSDEDARTVFRAAGQLPNAAWIPVARLALLTGNGMIVAPGHVPSITRAVMNLHAVSLVEELTGDRLRLHPLVHDFAQSLSDGRFGMTMAEQLSLHFHDVERLDMEVGARGADAVLEDLRTGLSLTASNRDSLAHGYLSHLERIIDREVHVLRGWDAIQKPAFLLQQLACRARAMGVLESLARAAEDKLSVGARARFELLWRTNTESQSLVRTLTGHIKGARCVAAFANGRQAATASEDGSVRIWEVETGRSLFLLAHTQPVHSIAVSADGRRLLSLSQDRVPRVWDVVAGHLERELSEQEDELIQCALTRDGALAATVAKSGALVLWDVDTGLRLRTLASPGGAMSVIAISADGAVVVAGGEDGQVRVWDGNTGEMVLTLAGHDGPIVAVACLANGALALTGGSDSTAQLWDLAGAREARILNGHIGPARSVALSPDGVRALTGDDKAIRHWDTAACRELTRHVGHIGWVTAVDFAGPSLAISGSTDATVRLWNLDVPEAASAPQGSGTVLRTGHNGLINEVTVSKDGTMAVSAAQDGTLRVWHLPLGTETHVLTGHASRVMTVALMPSAAVAVSGSADNTARVWDLETGKQKLVLAGHRKVVSRIRITADGSRAITGSIDGDLRVWDLASGTCTLVFKGHTGPVRDIALLGDGRRAVTASHDGAVCLWEIEDGREVARLSCVTTPYRLATLCDDTIVAFGSQTGSLCLWTPSASGPPRTLAGHSGPIWTVKAMPLRRQLLTASSDGLVKIWDIDSGGEVRSLSGHTGEVTQAAVTLDGLLVFSAANDGTVRVWDAERGTELACFSGEAPMLTLALVPGQNQCVSGDWAGNIYHLRYADANRA